MFYSTLPALSGRTGRSSPEIQGSFCLLSSPKEDVWDWLKEAFLQSLYLQAPPTHQLLFQKAPLECMGTLFPWVIVLSLFMLIQFCVIYLPDPSFCFRLVMISGSYIWKKIEWAVMRHSRGAPHARRLNRPLAAACAVMTGRKPQHIPGPHCPRGSPGAGSGLVCTDCDRPY